MPRTISRPDESLSFRNASCNSTISQKACHVASRFICRDSSFEYRSSLTEHLRQVSIVGHPVSVLFGVSSSTFRPFRRTDLFGEGRRAVVSRTAVWHPNQPIPIHSANLCDDGQTGNHGLDVLRDSRPSTHRARARARLLHTPQLFSTFSQRLTYSRRHASRPRKPYLALFTIRGTSSKSPIYDITWLVLGRPYRFSYERPKREHTNGNGEKVAADDEAPSKRKVSAGRVSEQLGRQVRRTGRRK